MVIRTLQYFLISFFVLGCSVSEQSGVIGGINLGNSVSVVSDPPTPTPTPTPTPDLNRTSPGTATPVPSPLATLTPTPTPTPVVVPTPTESTGPIPLPSVLPSASPEPVSTRGPIAPVPQLGFTHVEVRDLDGGGSLGPVLVEAHVTGATVRNAETGLGVVTIAFPVTHFRFLDVDNDDILDLIVMNANASATSPGMQIYDGGRLANGQNVRLNTNPVAAIKGPVFDIEPFTSSDDVKYVVARENSLGFFKGSFGPVAVRTLTGIRARKLQLVPAASNRPLHFGALLDMGVDETCNGVAGPGTCFTVFFDSFASRFDVKLTGANPYLQRSMTQVETGGVRRLVLAEPDGLRYFTPSFTTAERIDSVSFSVDTSLTGDGVVFGAALFSIHSREGRFHVLLEDDSATWQVDHLNTMFPYILAFPDSKYKVYFAVATETSLVIYEQKGWLSDKIEPVHFSVLRTLTLQ